MKATGEKDGAPRRGTGPFRSVRGKQKRENKREGLWRHRWRKWQRHEQKEGGRSYGVTDLVRAKDEFPKKNL